MPTENANEKPLEKEQKTVPLDTSGPGAEVIVSDEKDESEVETKDTEPTVTYTEPEKEEVEVKEPETIKEIKKEQKQEDTKLEEYSKGVQGRIAKLTRKMREAERQRDSATEYARALESQRQTDQRKFSRLDTDYWKRFETNVKTGMESAQRELAGAIESGDAKAQVEANKRIATLAFENARMQQAKEGREDDVKLSDGGKLPTEVPSSLPYQQSVDPKAEDWAGKNRWFGQDRAMTFTAFEIHKDLVEKEGYDPKSDDYYEEVNKRIRVDFPHKFGKSDNIQTTRPVQSVASANRSVKPGRQTVKLTPSQVAIAKKLGVPLEDYAKQLKLTKEV